MGRPSEALAALAAVEAADASRYQPYWLTRACVQKALGDREAAQSALQRALALTLTNAPALRRHVGAAMAAAPGKGVQSIGMPATHPGDAAMVQTIPVRTGGTHLTGIGQRLVQF